MSHRVFESVREELRSRMPSPCGEGGEELARRIRVAFDGLPRDTDPDDPWLGGPPGDYAWLAEYENLPDHPQDADRVLSTAARALRGQLRWHSPATLFNMTPQPLLDTAAITAVAGLYSPNALWDFSSAGVIEVERQLVRQFARRAGWQDTAGGVFSFGGKAGLLYAVRMGLNRCSPDSYRDGLPPGGTPVVVTTAHNHDSLESVCALLGLGTGACVRVPAEPGGRVAPDAIAEVVDALLAEGRPVACVVLSGGNILHNAIDPVRPVTAALDRVRAAHALPYRPLVHFDTVVTWPWLFFTDYDFAGDPLGLGPELGDQIRATAGLVSQVREADSMTIDFHKTGLAPYSSSLFLTRDAAELHRWVEGGTGEAEHRPHGENVLLHTIEHSRSAAPVLAAWVAVQSVGVDGFRVYLANLLMANRAFMDLLPSRGFELLTPFSDGVASVYWPVPPDGTPAFTLLREAGPSAVEAANRYTHTLFRLLAGYEGNPYARVVLGHLPAYGTGPGGEPVAALRLVPGSVFLDEATCFQIAGRMEQVKKALDVAVRFGSGKLNEAHVYHVPE
ncbi:pyridoxal phosphate-dependent decarboxylase family protein [Nocardiopsis sp. NPDC058631]|uniref:pyridoxal phosphate-dependent decarboxylase family protein n=1 Tax=Nocardiopsis sp. NPDC058631 TaxID=3346566 RepID=UPI003646093B